MYLVISIFNNRKVDKLEFFGFLIQNSILTYIEYRLFDTIKTS